MSNLSDYVKGLDDEVWTDNRASNLDNADTTVSSRAPASSALSTSVWTNTRAGYLDQLAGGVGGAAISKHAEVNASSINVNLGVAFDEGKSQVQVSVADAGFALFQTDYRWNSASQLSVYRIESNGTINNLAGTAKVTVVEFVQ